MSEVKDKLTEGILNTFQDIGKQVVESIKNGSASEPTDEQVVEKDTETKTDEVVEKDNGLTVEDLSTAMGTVVESMKDYIDEKLKTKEDKVAEKKATVVESMKNLLAEQGFDTDNHEIDISISEVKKGSGKKDIEGLKMKINGSEDTDDSDDEPVGSVEDLDPELRKAAGMEIWRGLMFAGRK